MVALADGISGLGIAGGGASPAGVADPSRRWRDRGRCVAVAVPALPLVLPQAGRWCAAGGRPCPTPGAPPHHRPLPRSPGRRREQLGGGRPVTRAPLLPH